MSILALLDINLPDMKGTELLVKLHRNVPLMMKVMITGYPAFNDTVDCVNLGANAYLTKPVNPKKLLKIVNEKLNEQEVYYRWDQYL